MGTAHAFQSIAIQDIDVIPDPEDDEAVLGVKRGEPDERFGCKICNMPLEEALESPCPGRPIEQMLDD